MRTQAVRVRHVESPYERGTISSQLGPSQATLVGDTGARIDTEEITRVHLAMERRFL